MGPSLNPESTSVYDYMIVGYGLAGCLMSFLLSQSQKKILIIDNDHQDSASLVAAGIINPVTGKSFVKSWRIEEFLPSAIELYKEIENKEKINILTFTNILRVLKNIESENVWLSKAADPEYSKYLLTKADTSELENKITFNPHYGEITGSLKVNLSVFVQHMKEKNLKSGKYFVDNFNHDLLSFNDDIFEYKNFKAKKIIFCEGYRGEQNPFFKNLMFAPSKGEALIIRIPGANFSKMIKNNMFLVNLKEDVYWFGGGYEWRASDSLPSKTAFDNLKSELDKLLTIPYTILDHRAAIRPSTKKRKPLLLQHEEMKNMYFFNGLGTKGTSLAPLIAKTLWNHLENDLDFEAIEFGL